MFKKMKIWQKILLTSMIFVLPTLLLVYFLVHEKNIAINFGEKEKSGIEYLNAVSALYNDIVTLNLLVVSRGGSDETLNGQIESVKQKIEMLSKTGLAISHRGKNGELQQHEFENTVVKTVAEVVTDTANQEKYQLGMTDCKNLWAHVGNTSNLILDPDLDSFYLMDYCVVKTPEGIDLIRRLYIAANNVILKKSITPEEKTNIIILSSLLRSNINDGMKNIETAIANDSTSDKKISKNVKEPALETNEAVTAFLNKIDEDIANQIFITLDASELLQSGNIAIEKYYTSYVTVSYQLTELLDKRVGSFVKNEIVTLSIVLIFVFLAFFSCYLVIKEINYSVHLAAHTLTEMAEGNLDVSVNITRDDELGLVLRRINDFINSLNDIIRELSNISGSLDNTSGELTESSNTLSRNSQDQSAAVEEITATTEQISANIESIADGSMTQVKKIDSLEDKIHMLSSMIGELDERLQNANKLTADMINEIKSREVSLQQMNGSMESIRQSSLEMVNIVEIISDISDQINLLSLNAAIEAARAGDYGKGFAVVSDEISKLADSTAQSIKDIDVLIKKNDVEINNGMHRTTETISSISALINNVASINEMITSISGFMDNQKEINNQVISESGVVKNLSDEINSAIIQQKNAMHEILQSTSMINTLTQTNAGGAEEITATADGMKSASRVLKEKLSFFRIKI